jgi:hypothetical protein
MERVGFFMGDISEPVQAFDEQVNGRGRKVEGLEIVPAGTNPGMPGMRRTMALNRIDIPTLWRAVVRPGDKKSGPVVSIFAPRGVDPAECAPKLTGLGVMAPNTGENKESFDCIFQPETPTMTLVQFAMDAIRGIGGLGSQGELQWTVRAKGALPR